MKFSFLSSHLLKLSSTALLGSALFFTACGEDQTTGGAGGEGGQSDSNGTDAPGGAPSGPGETPEPPEETCVTRLASLVEGEIQAEADAADVQDFPLPGSWTDEWESSHEITESAWNQSGSLFHFTLVNTCDQFVIAYNDAENEYNPEKWSKLSWVKSGENFYFCQAPYDADSEDAASEAPAPQTDDLDAGCNGFSWSQLMPIMVE